MRLKLSRNAAEERLTALLAEGYALQGTVYQEYTAKSLAGSFNASIDVSYFRRIFDDWNGRVTKACDDIFPLSLESSYFSERRLFMNVSLPNVPLEFSAFYYQEVPLRFERLREVISAIQKYNDLHINDRLFVEDIDSFSKVRDVNPSLVDYLLKDGFLSLSENQVQVLLEQILTVSFHQKDWGGEINDLYTANVIVSGTRRATAFLLKGPGIGKKVMEISDCGKRGDQLVRLFTSPADLFVVQYVGPISDNVIKDVEGKVANAKAVGKEAHFLIMNGQDTARLLYAYGKL